VFKILVLLIMAGSIVQPARSQTLVSAATGDLGKFAFVVKAPNSAEWLFLRLTREQDRVIRNEGPARVGEAVPIQITLRQCRALAQALREGSPPQSLKLRVLPSEIHAIKGFTGRYLARKRTVIVAHMRLPSGSGPNSADVPPGVVLEALPGIVQDLPGRDDDW